MWPGLITDSGVANVLPPVQLDVERDAWPSADAVVCINMVHIAPWSATLGLLRGSAACLPNGGRLILYGPYRFDGVFTAPSNEQFDRSLREQNSTWGVRDLSRIGQRAEAVGFDAEPDIVPLPANNHLAIFRKSGASS